MAHLIARTDEARQKELRSKESTMTPEKTQMLFAAIVTTLAETDNEAPGGVIYTALMNEFDSLSQYNFVIGIGKEMAVWTVSRSHVVRLTSKGVELAEKITEVLEAS